jgi:hypothetical protein
MADGEDERAAAMEDAARASVAERARAVEGLLRSGKAADAVKAAMQDAPVGLRAEDVKVCVA